MTENYHTHTARCRHATGTEREYIETAIERGLRVLGFSDHCPQFFPGEFYSNFRMRPEEADGYIQTLCDLRKEYRQDIDIKIGFETEYYPEIFGDFLKFVEPYELDYLILGQHFIDNEYDTHIYAYSYGNTPEILKKYVDQCLEALSTGKFSYIAHPDLLVFNGDEGIFKKEYRRLCEGAKKHNIPLEINFLGLGAGRAYPTEEFFSIAKEVGNDIIFGADAHSPDDVCNPNVLETAKAFADKLGIVPIETLSLRKI